MVTGYGGPEQPAIVPAHARERILADHPDLVTAHHPMTERWWEDFDGYTREARARMSTRSPTSAA